MHRDRWRRGPERISRPCSSGFPGTHRARIATAARTAESPAGAAPAPAGSRARRRGWRPGCSLAPPVLEIPAAEALFRRFRHLALPSPRIEPVVDGEARQALDGEPRRRYRRAIKPRVAQHLADEADGFFLDQRQLIALGHDLPPFVDLIVDVDLHRADIGAAAVERRGIGQIAVFTDVEGRVDDDADRTGIG